MRKIVYSVWLKAVAVIVMIACIVFGVLTAATGVMEYWKEEEDIYSFENDFSESWYISALLDEPENAMFNAYQRTFHAYDEYGNPVEPNVTHAELEENIRQWFRDFYNSDKINYFVQWNDMVLTNCGAKTAEELLVGEYYSCFKRDSSGHTERISSADRGITRAYLLEDIEHFDRTSTMTISCNIKEETVKEYKVIWERQEGIVIHTFVQTLVYAVIGLLLFVYLICVCGRNKDGEQESMWIDNIWAEIHLAAIAGFGVGAAVLCALALDEYVSGHFPHKLIYWALGTVSALGSLVVITSLLSVVRNIKTRKLVETSIILRVLRWLLRLTKKAAKWIYKKGKAAWRTFFKVLSKKTGIILITMLLVYTALIGLMGIGTYESPVWLFLGIVLFGVACFGVAYRTKDLDEIKKGVSAVRNGNIAYKIPALKCEDMRMLAANINDLAKGLDESLSARVKAERLKTELITNVSHDLKTPITSIINYTELLSKIEALPEEAKDYVSVIAKKSDGLKRLTQDLFDISKVQSGNDEAVLEKLDVALLINQTLGEHDREIQNSGLQFCVEVPKELYISADGRKMSRALSNLLSNILKYTMKGTRVFITASAKDESVELEFKNISAYPLNFNVEEITHRFVRGDESRTAEGNGLGLAIAKSYTEICGGIFEIIVDGDMFKAILKFREYDERRL